MTRLWGDACIADRKLNAMRRRRGRPVVIPASMILRDGAANGFSPFRGSRLPIGPVRDGRDSTPRSTN